MWEDSLQTNTDNQGLQFAIMSFDANVRTCYNIIIMFIFLIVGRDSSVGIATGYGLGSPGIETQWGVRFSAPVQTSPGVHPASCKMGTSSFPGVKSGWDVTLTSHPLLVPQSRKGRAIPLLPIRTVRPVQSLSACTRVTFTLPQSLYKGDLYLTSVPVQG